jgi:hypothetical protein
MEEEMKYYHTPTLPKNINQVQMEEMRSTFATPGWKLLDELLQEKQKQCINIVMNLASDDKTKSEFINRFIGFKAIRNLPAELDESFEAGTIENNS